MSRLLTKIPVKIAKATPPRRTMTQPTDSSKRKSPVPVFQLTGTDSTRASVILVMLCLAGDVLACGAGVLHCNLDIYIRYI